jgi:deoxyribodipyrimidine photo-lyase
MRKHQLVWFRNDLRVTDNPALFRAIENGSPVIAIYIATPEQWLRHDDAAIKIDFWRRNLRCLQKTLNQLNIDLYFFQVATYKEIPELIASICHRWQVEQLYFNQEYAFNERQRDRAVADACQRINVHVSSYHDQLLLPPKTVRTKSEEPYKVFTPFAKVARQKIQNLSTLSSPVKVQKCTEALITLPEQLDLNQVSWPQVDQTMQSKWPEGEESALESLNNFCKNNIEGYTQNRDIPSVTGTSQLSPYLTSGVLSVKQCWLATTRYCELSDGFITWQNELLWREFYRNILIDYPRVSKHKPWKEKTDKVRWRNDKNELEAWQQGQTGFPIIDAAMRQLLDCGWMHNRLRMITAMFLSKYLLIDWRLGERWFMQHLIDGDLASNNGGWQWCASTGTDSVPYFRLLNPVTQSRKHDQHGEFIRHYLPELSHLDAQEIHFPIKSRPEDYPQPIIDLAIGRERAFLEFKALG